MARGKWLSEEEKADITRMRARGMTNAQIATQMQRGVKTIQRVLNGTHALTAEGDSPVRTCTRVSPAHQVGCQEPSTHSLVLAVVSPDASTVKAAQVRPVESIQATATAAKSSAKTIKMPVRPKKLPRQLTASPDTSNLSASSHATIIVAERAGPVRSARDVETRGSTGDLPTIPVDDGIRGQREHNATSISPTNATSNCLESRPPSQVPTISLHHSTLQTMHSTTSFSAAQSGGLDENNLVLQPLERQLGCMVGLIPYGDSDDECESPQSGTTTVTSTSVANSLQDPRQYGDGAVSTGTSRRQPAQATSQNDQWYFTESNTSAIESPLLSFENQLRSSQASSWAPSQIEPEPVLAKKRKVDMLEKVVDPVQQDPIERALALLNQVVTRVRTTSKIELYEERLGFLIQRFQADVRLVQLERKKSRIQFPGETTFTF